jgi:hypothetical protein
MQKDIQHNNKKGNINNNDNQPNGTEDLCCVLILNVVYTQFDNEGNYTECR